MDTINMIVDLLIVLFNLRMIHGSDPVSERKSPWLLGQSLDDDNDWGENTFTQLNGCPIYSKLDTLTAGKKGPLLMEDVQFLDEMSHFDRERIPERVVHARGVAAFGYFEVTNPEFSRYTKARFLIEPGKKTRVAARFSTVIGSKGSADTVRDPRGFSVKFYTEEGIFDFVGLDFPVFPVRDSLRFISFVHSQKPDPAGNWVNYNYYWDFLANNPEALHFFSYLFSDLGTPDGYRTLPGFSINTYKLTNAEGQVVYARFKFTPDKDPRTLTRFQAEKLAGTEPSYSSKDLYDAIKHGDYPSWTVGAQIMDARKASEATFNILDPTKIWWEDKYPVIEIGRLTLDKNVRNDFAEQEQLAFSPSALVPGIDPSTDKIFQGRLFSYRDTQHYRLGVNVLNIPVNRPKNKVYAPNVRDGFATYDDNYGSEPGYLPNSYSSFKVDPSAKPVPWSPSEPDIVHRFETMKEDNYSQAGELWRSLSKQEKNTLVDNIGSHLSKASKDIQEKVVAQYSKVDLEYGARVAQILAKYNSD